jgi:glycosyltransferase involved in cell wall biosynthesis
MRAVWSGEAYRAVRRQLQAKPYDAVHVHNFFPLLSPSVYYAARAEGVPVVQTLHQYRLFCPVGTFFRDGHVCEDCFKKCIPWPGVLHGCYRGSSAATAVVASMLAVHNTIGTWRDLVAYYIVLSRFEHRKFIEGGLPADKIVLKPNFLADPPEPGAGDGGYAVFVGRICEEKGVRTLLKAWRKIGRRLPLKILGTGPLASEVEQMAPQIEGVEYLGFQPKERIYEIVGGAECIIAPSQWYEGQPVVVIEALALGTPLILSRIGPMSEFIEHGESGLLFEPGNVEDLVAKIEWLLGNRHALPEMRSRVREIFEKWHTPERNFQMLSEIYRSAKLRKPVRGRQAESEPLASEMEQVEQ